MTEVVITGFLNDNVKMEIVNISTNAMTKICQAISFNYPLDFGDASGALVNNEIIVCGGFDDRSKTKTALCYKFDQHHKWKLISQMSTSRYKSASIAISNGLWITGGFTNNTVPLQSTEIILSSGLTTVGPPLPQPRSSHCLVKYGDIIFSIGTACPNRFEENV